MPTIDPTRAAFVQKDYRYKISEDLTVKALYPNAEEFKLDTQMSEGDAATLAAGLLAALKVPGRVFQVLIAKGLRSDDFAGGLPRYTATFPEYNLLGVVVRVLSAEIDYLKDESVLVVRT